MLQSFFDDATSRRRIGEAATSGRCSEAVLFPKLRERRGPGTLCAGRRPPCTFYYNFDSKQDLALAAIDADWATQKAEIYEPAFAADEGALESFGRYQELLYEFHRRRHGSTSEYGSCLIVGLAQETALTDPAIGDRARACLAEASTYLELAMGRAIDQGVLPACDTKDFAKRALGYVEGMLTQARIDQSPERIREMRYELWRLARPHG